jgi:LysM repeat protein
VKADSLAIINPSALRETENLRAENSALRNQIELLRAQLAARPVTAAAQGSEIPATREPTGFAPPAGNSVTGGRTESPRGSVAAPSGSATQPRSGSTSPTPSARSGRTHTVQSGDTLMSIARRYGVKVTALQSANPGLDPKRMKVGQTLNLP